MNKSFERLYNGIIKENPTFVLMLGMCPTLAVTTSVVNAIGMGLSTAVVLACLLCGTALSAIGMGLSTTAVLMFSNLIISLLRNIIPDRVRIPAFIVIVASLVTVVQLLMQGYTPELYKSLGIYIPLIVVNCIILGRAESYASKSPAIPSFFDGLGMGLGFTIALSCIGFVRELLGAGTIFDKIRVIPEEFNIPIFVLAPGAFFILSLLTALQNKLKLPSATNTEKKESKGCGCGCSVCGCGMAENTTDKEKAV